MASLRLVAFGPEAARALRDAIVAAKRGDALAPVTVAVPSNYAGLSLRRSLGRGELSLDELSGREGLINVRFLVLARVAELLGAPSLASQGRRPLTGPVRAEAVRAALAAGPGVFRDVAGHAATERSLDVTFRDLSRAPEAGLDAVARQSERAADVVRLFRDFRARTAEYYDEEELWLAAADSVRAGSAALRDVGHVILYLPRRLSPAEESLLLALARAGGLTAIVGLAGDEEADAPARTVAARLERVLGAADEAAPASPPAGTRIVAVTDAEEEVRTALRLIMELVQQGTPLHRMAVLYPTAQPYALLAHEQFHAAGVPHNGPSVRTLAQTLSGRTLLGLLRLREADFPRDAVMDWLSAAPVLERAGGRHAPAQRWEALSRSAGVVRGATQWRDRLRRHARQLRARLEALDRTDEGKAWQVRRLEIDIEQADRLAAFIEELAGNLDARRHTTWPEFAAWARGLLERYLGGEGHRRDWPNEELEAHRAVEEALVALAALRDVRERTDEATFRRALERELEAPAGRIGHFGEGVFTGRFADALGTEFDAVFLIGMSEGLVPPREREDPLLPDRERRTAGEEMPLRTGRRAEARRDYLAALAAAPQRVLVFPRADLRGQRGRLPAHWLLETASRLEGRPLFSKDLEELQRDWYRPVASFEAALRDGIEPASEQEYDLRSLVRWPRATSDHYLVQNTAPLRDGVAAELARRSAVFTRWDGRLAPGEAPAPSAERAVSPTALQDWAACPFRYFLGHVLRVAETEKPEDTLTLSPLERGNIIHRALERFVSEAPARSSPGEPWSETERARQLQIGEELCDEAEAAGLAGRALLWRLARARILRDLAGFLDADEALRHQHGVVPADVELSFGIDSPPLVASLAGGRTIAFRGRIDRVDRAPDGSRLLVLDYKSGSDAFYSKLHIDPLQRGRLLQLPVYALAARDRYGIEAVEAYYWFATEDADYGRRGYPLGDDELQLFRETAAVIVGGIGGGLFPARPGKRSSDDGFENCRLCPFDRVCPPGRDDIWKRKRRAPELRAYLDLAEPEE